MLKKLIILLFILLVSCDSKQVINEEKQYIDPINDLYIFDELNTNNQELINLATGNKEYRNEQFKMLYKDIYCKDIVDIFGNKYNLSKYDNLVFEVVSVECEHCKNFIKEHSNNLLSHGIQVVQYFNVGNKDEIINFYNDMDMEIPNNIIVVEKNDDLYSYVKDYIRIVKYPSLISYKNGKVSFMVDGEKNDSNLNAFYNISFINPLTIEDLSNEDGNSYIEICRNENDVLNSLSDDNLSKLKSLDNDDNTVSYTSKLIGSKVDYDNMSGHKDSTYISDIEDYSYYKDKNVVLLFTYLNDASEIEKINEINNIIAMNDNLEYIVVLVEGMESSSNIYRSMPIKFNCKVVSVLGYIPNDFFKLGIKNYPTAFFIESGTYTGAYSNIEKDRFNEAIDLFIGDNSIALVGNN